MNYEELLRKYMRLVISAEGITFLREIKEGQFTDEEEVALHKMADAISKEDVQ